MFDGQFEAQIVALTCSDAPKGYRRWTVRLLAEKAVERDLTSSVSHMTRQRIVKKECTPYLKNYWKISPKEHAACVAAMEDVLEVYHLPYDQDFPGVCMEESCKQLVGVKCEPHSLTSLVSQHAVTMNLEEMGCIGFYGG